MSVLPERPNNRERKKRIHDAAGLLKAIEPNVHARARFNLRREGPFRGVMKSAFVKAYECARYCNELDEDKADEGAYFISSALRGICEDLIALKFVGQLPKKQRDEVILIEMAAAVKKAITEQQKFFKKVRPFQPVLSGGIDDASILANKARLNTIGRSSGLWSTDGKLPPIEQMAIKLKMRAIYDYFYRITSDVVHFNPRIALRNGWGPSPERGTFSGRNFAGYYLDFCQVYSLFLFIQFCRSFRAALSLPPPFVAQIKLLEEAINSIGRWPEAITFQEMNIKDPGLPLRMIAKAIHDIQKKEKAEKRKAAAKRAALPSTS